eukprot:scaffold180594_cov23-Tisochrysis_lutea.AAC.1
MAIADSGLSHSHSHSQAASVIHTPCPMPHIHITLHRALKVGHSLAASARHPPLAVIPGVGTPVRVPPSTLQYFTRY